MEANRLAHSNAPGEAARRAAEAARNIRPQTVEEKERTDALVLEAKLRAFGSLEAQERHQVLAQIQLPRMLVHIGLLAVENLAVAEAEVQRALVELS